MRGLAPVLCTLSLCGLVASSGCANGDSDSRSVSQVGGGDVRGQGTPSIDSESHFLSYCASGCPDGLSCLCGVCTRVCDGSEQCTELDPDAQCVEPTPAGVLSCSNQRVRTVCDLACADDAECSRLGTDHQCVSGLCRAPAEASSECPEEALPTCAEGESLVVSRDPDDGCLDYLCEGANACRAQFDSARCSSVMANEADGPEQFWLNPKTARCETAANLDACGLQDVAFDSARACWDNCMTENYATCLEVWDSTWESTDVYPRYQHNLTGELTTLTKQEALELLAGERRATLTYPDRTQTELIIELESTEVYHVSVDYNPWGGSLGIPIEHQCTDAIVAEVNLRFSTADGAFNERWERLALAVLPRVGYGRVSIHLNDDWGAPNDSEVWLLGDYAADISANNCSLSTNLSLQLDRQGASGSVNHLVLALPCNEVTETTGISSPTPSDATEFTLPVPPGPVWSSDRTQPEAQFCSAATPNYLGPDAYVRGIDQRNLLDADIEPERFASDVETECEEQGGAVCAAERFISYGAAECIAQAAGLPRGNGLNTQLEYDPGNGRVTWMVWNSSDQGGAFYFVDAISGELIDDNTIMPFSP